MEFQAEALEALERQTLSDLRTRFTDELGGTPQSFAALCAHCRETLYGGEGTGVDTSAQDGDLLFKAYVYAKMETALGSPLGGSLGVQAAVLPAPTLLSFLSVEIASPANENGVLGSGRAASGEGSRVLAKGAKGGIAQSGLRVGLRRIGQRSSPSAEESLDSVEPGEDTESVKGASSSHLSPAGEVLEGRHDSKSVDGDNASGSSGSFSRSDSSGHSKRSRRSTRKEAPSESPDRLHRSSPHSGSSVASSSPRSASASEGRRSTSSSEDHSKTEPPLSRSSTSSDRSSSSTSASASRKSSSRSRSQTAAPSLRHAEGSVVSGPGVIRASSSKASEYEVNRQLLPPSQHASCFCCVCRRLLFQGVDLDGHPLCRRCFEEAFMFLQPSRVESAGGEGLPHSEGGLPKCPKCGNPPVRISPVTEPSGFRTQFRFRCPMYRRGYGGNRSLPDSHGRVGCSERSLSSERTGAFSRSSSGRAASETVGSSPPGGADTEFAGSKSLSKLMCTTSSSSAGFLDSLLFSSASGRSSSGFSAPGASGQSTSGTQASQSSLRRSRASAAPAEWSSQASSLAPSLSNPESASLFTTTMGASHSETLGLDVSVSPYLAAGPVFGSRGPSMSPALVSGHRSSVSFLAVQKDQSLAGELSAPSAPSASGAPCERADGSASEGTSASEADPANATEERVSDSAESYSKQNTTTSSSTTGPEQTSDDERNLSHSLVSHAVHSIPGSCDFVGTYDELLRHLASCEVFAQGLRAEPDLAVSALEYEAAAGREAELVRRVACATAVFLRGGATRGPGAGSSAPEAVKGGNTAAAETDPAMGPAVMPLADPVADPAADTVSDRGSKSEAPAASGSAHCRERQEGSHPECSAVPPQLLSPSQPPRKPVGDSPSSPRDQELLQVIQELGDMVDSCVVTLQDPQLLESKSPDWELLSSVASASVDPCGSPSVPRQPPSPGDFAQPASEALLPESFSESRRMLAAVRQRFYELQARVSGVTKLVARLRDERLSFQREVSNQCIQQREREQERRRRSKKKRAKATQTNPEVQPAFPQRLTAPDRALTISQLQDDGPAAEPENRATGGPGAEPTSRPRKAAESGKPSVESGRAHSRRKVRVRRSKLRDSEVAGTPVGAGERLAASQRRRPQEGPQPVDVSAASAGDLQEHSLPKRRRVRRSTTARAKEGGASGVESSAVAASGAGDGEDIAATTAAASTSAVSVADAGTDSGAALTHSAASARRNRTRRVRKPKGSGLHKQASSAGPGDAPDAKPTSAESGGVSLGDRPGQGSVGVPGSPSMPDEPEEPQYYAILPQVDPEPSVPIRTVKLWLESLEDMLPKLEDHFLHFFPPGGKLKTPRGSAEPGGSRSADGLGAAASGGAEGPIERPTGPKGTPASPPEGAPRPLHFRDTAADVVQPPEEQFAEKLAIFVDYVASFIERQNGLKGILDAITSATNAIVAQAAVIEEKCQSRVQSIEESLAKLQARVKAFDGALADAKRSHMGERARLTAIISSMSETCERVKDFEREKMEAHRMSVDLLRKVKHLEQIQVQPSLPDDVEEALRSRDTELEILRSKVKSMEEAIETFQIVAKSKGEQLLDMRTRLEHLTRRVAQLQRVNREAADQQARLVAESAKLTATDEGLLRIGLRRVGLNVPLQGFSMLPMQDLEVLDESGLPLEEVGPGSQFDWDPKLKEIARSRLREESQREAEKILFRSRQDPASGASAAPTASSALPPSWDLSLQEFEKGLAEFLRPWDPKGDDAESVDASAGGKGGSAPAAADTHGQAFLVGGGGAASTLSGPPGHSPQPSQARWQGVSGRQTPPKSSVAFGAPEASGSAAGSASKPAGPEVTPSPLPGNPSAHSWRPGDPYPLEGRGMAEDDPRGTLEMLLSAKKFV